jgi:amidase
MMVGEYMIRAYGGRYYGRAQNLARLLADSYDQALKRVDILALPTAPFPVPRLPGADATREEAVNAAFGMTVNTAARQERMLLRPSEDVLLGPHSRPNRG